MTLITELQVPPHSTIDVEDDLVVILEGVNNGDSEDCVYKALIQLQKKDDYNSNDQLVATLLFTQSFKLYNKQTVLIDDEIVESLIEDENKKVEIVDVRPQYEKLDEIERLCELILNRISSKYTEKQISELLGKSFNIESHGKRFNLNEYYTKCFKSESKFAINSFLNLLQLIKFPNFNDYLIMLTVKLSLKLIENYDYSYSDKLTSLALINYLIVNTTKSDLNVNNRALLLLDTLERYMHDKDSLRFLYELHSTQLHLLAICESQYAANEHDYKLHSKCVNNLLNNCLLCSNLSVKIVYFVILKQYLLQMNIYMIKYLTKLFDILLVDTIDYMKANIHFKYNFILIKLIFNMIEICATQYELRIHAHAKMIIKFLVKFIYYLCLDYETDEEIPIEFNESLFLDYESCCSTDRFYSLKYAFKILIKHLFNNEKVRENEYNEFLMLSNTQTKTNQYFQICLDFICKECQK